jgi:hypothetical protein
VELLPQADVVIIMEAGAVTHCGPYNAAVAERFGGPRPAEFLAGADSQLADAVGAAALTHTDEEASGAPAVPFDEVLRIVDQVRRMNTRRWVGCGVLPPLPSLCKCL